MSAPVLASPSSSQRPASGGRSLVYSRRRPELTTLHTVVLDYVARHIARAYDPQRIKNAAATLIRR